MLPFGICPQLDHPPYGVPNGGGKALFSGVIYGSEVREGDGPR